MSEHEIIWIEDERTIGYLLNEGAHVSEVLYYRDGMEVRTFLERDDYTVLEGHDFDDDHDE